MKSLIFDFLVHNILIIYTIFAVSCTSLRSDESEIRLSFTQSISCNTNPFSLSTEKQITSWELFIYDKTISAFTIHESKVISDPLNPEPYELKIIPTHEYELSLYVNDATLNHLEPGFAMAMPVDGKSLPGAAQCTFTYSKDGFSSPLIIPQVFRLVVEKIENKLGKDIVIDDIYLASAAVTSDYELVDQDGYCSYTLPYFYGSLSRELQSGQVADVNTRLYAFPLLPDAPKTARTYLMLSTSQGYYYYELPQTAMAPGASLQISKVVISRPGGATPFQEVMDVEISSISIVGREKEGNVDINL